jgi:hypothetical protein
MHILIVAFWKIIPFLNFVSFALLAWGVLLFGWHLLKTVSKDQGKPEDNLSPAIWQGRPTKIALKFFAAGAALMAFTILLSAVLPPRY